MSAELDRLKASVTKITQVKAGIVSTLEGLSARLREVANDPAQVNALADELDGDATDFANAITANTPA